MLSSPSRWHHVLSDNRPTPAFVLSWGSNVSTLALWSCPTFLDIHLLAGLSVFSSAPESTSTLQIQHYKTPCCLRQTRMVTYYIFQDKSAFFLSCFLKTERFTDSSATLEGRIAESRHKHKDREQRHVNNYMFYFSKIN